jgi:hypothetical protein
VLEDAELMAEGEDLKLQRGLAREGSEKRGPKSRQQVPTWESKERGNSQFLNHLGVGENDSLWI